MRIGSVLLSVLTVLAPTVGPDDAAQASTGGGTPPAVSRLATGDHGHSSERDAIARLVDLAAARIAIADTVAAAKWGTHGSIDDPAREQVVLDAAAQGAADRGIDPAITATVFRDQIEASKVVQYGLFSQWSAVPEDAPTETPDLAAIRPQLDAITGGLLDGLAATQDLRADGSCGAALRSARHDVERARTFDALHHRALGRALRSVCS